MCKDVLDEQDPSVSSVTKETAVGTGMQEQLDFRAVFEKTAFGIVREASTGLPVSPPITAKTSKSRTKVERDKQVFILRHWDTGAEGLNATEFHANYYKWHKNWKSYSVTTNVDGEPTLWHTCGKTHKKSRVVNIEQVFDIVTQYHKRVGHLAIDSAHNSFKDYYSNIARQLVKIYCELCPVCCENQPISKPMKGAVKPIETFRYRDRFQVSTFNYSFPLVMLL